jgi:NAD dependent epimerase/dehydratase family enzyme
MLKIHPKGGFLNFAHITNPLPNATFMAELRSAAHVRFGLPASRSLLEAGAFVLGTESELVLKSRRVVPHRLLEAGFRFAFPQWHLAATELVERARSSVHPAIAARAIP